MRILYFYEAVHVFIFHCRRIDFLAGILTPRAFISIFTNDFKRLLLQFANYKYDRTEFYKVF